MNDVESHYTSWYGSNDRVVLASDYERLRANGRRPWECYEMSLIDDAMKEQP